MRCRNNLAREHLSDPRNRVEERERISIPTCVRSWCMKHTSWAHRQCFKAMIELQGAVESIRGYITSGNTDSRTHRLRGEGFMICETRGSKVERQTNEESTTAYCQSEYQLPISAVSLYDCMPRTATPILRSTTLTAQARDRTQCQCPFRYPLCSVVFASRFRVRFVVVID